MPGVSAAAPSRAVISFIAVLAALLLPVFVPAGASAQIGGSRYAAFLQDADTGEVLLAINADAPRYPASLTKMMTLYLVFDAMQHGRLAEGTRIRVSRHAAGMEPSRLGLQAGSTIRARDAVMALVTRSANDAAAALAEHLGGGSEAAFARMMTRRARALGMRGTTFRNASGLPYPAQVTTAHDIAVLSGRLIRDFPTRYAYFSAPSFDWHGQHIPNHNRLLAGYDGADGIKTGFIRASGFNLAASAMRDGRRLIAVVFGGATGAERDAHVMALLDRGFDQIRRDAPIGTMIARRLSPPQVVSSAAAAVIRPVRRPAPTRARAAAAPRAGQWAVQVGAYATRDAAQAAARHAASQGGRMDLHRVRARGGWLWRARVTGLSATAARGICHGRSGPCQILAPGRR
ncbi:MAG TPA: D-alanyl-D-alanine carboxypeptidase family protein [Roseomonas sp.]|jgi:D-alanyl-D-alanine carboxypeptidase